MGSWGTRWNVWHLGRKVLATCVRCEMPMYASDLRKDIAEYCPLCLAGFGTQDKPFAESPIIDYWRTVDPEEEPRFASL